MAENTKIQWCEHTDNLWQGCTEVHAGCDHCYARVLSHRWGKDLWGIDKPRQLVKSVWNDFKKQQTYAMVAEQRHRVFVGSMMDIFEKPMPVVNAQGELQDYNTGDIRNRYFSEVVPNTPNLIHMMLTKRPSNILKYIPEDWKINPPANVVYGTSPVDQETADKLIPQLLQVPGKHFLSIEPLLGPIDLRRWLSLATTQEYYNSKNEFFKGEKFPAKFDIGQIIIGGESGKGAREMKLEWVEDLISQCQAAGVPVFVKQLGAWQVRKLTLHDSHGGAIEEWPKHLQVREDPNF